MRASAGVLNAAGKRRLSSCEDTARRKKIDTTRRKRCRSTTRSVQRWVPKKLGHLLISTTKKKRSSASVGKTRRHVSFVPEVCRRREGVEALASQSVPGIKSIHAVQLQARGHLFKLEQLRQGSNRDKENCLLYTSPSPRD